MAQKTYAQAINEGLRQAMELSPEVLVMGQLVDYKSGIFGTTTGLVDRFGPARVRDFPVAENLMTAAAMGAALTGLRPVIVHQRLDFMIYSLDAIVNWMSLWRFKSNGHSGLPVTIRAIVGKRSSPATTSGTSFGKSANCASLEQIMAMLPNIGPMRGINQMKVDEKELVHIEAIINSMTPQEREHHHILNGSRRKRMHWAADGLFRRSIACFKA